MLTRLFGDLAAFPPEVRQLVVVHLVEAGAPLERGIVLAASRHFPRRANPLAVGVRPQTNQQLRIKRWSPAFFHAALDALVEVTQIHTPDQRPERPRWMVFTDQPLHINGPPAHLLSVHVADQRLLA